jgi:hypothetical protein
MTEMSASPPGRHATRAYSRRRADVPVEVASAGAPVRRARHTYNVTVGGLAFESDDAFLPDAIVTIRIPTVRPAFETRARVVWCRVGAHGYELGVEFLDPEDAFRARMVEQVCHIEEYREEVRRAEGRRLTAEEAAIEWIGKHAAEFPDPDPAT